MAHSTPQTLVLQNGEDDQFVTRITLLVIINNNSPSKQHSSFQTASIISFSALRHFLHWVGRQ